ncbi:regulator of chromosome condensation, putative [Plasmodium gallinaceum]|uniref:Regulator of chromosome condensation, putative n=1 Tax=Plasmodium gallinaceum TaxID=5849 RepID=A0A1J1H0X0_PLAGA|nr:regulator of chromosome condensation, putative [Plasmodium gallinaceum]CRG98101.1 regulator of chromosome condensation, putative [Plasmodium gallinaceum]
MYTRFLRFFVIGLNSYYLIKRKNKIFFCEDKQIEKVFLFGDKRSLIKDIKENGEATFFEKNQIKVKKITFGNCIGSCITENDDIYIWGSYENKENNDIIYINPVKLNIKEIISDIQFSNNDIYLMSKKGELKIIRNYENCLRTGKFIIENFYKCKDSFFFRSERIIKLSVNKFHLAFVTNKGNIFCSGNNFYGQCAKEPSLKNNLNLNYNFDFLNNFSNSLNTLDNTHRNIIENDYSVKKENNRSEINNEKYSVDYHNKVEEKNNNTNSNSNKTNLELVRTYNNLEEHKEKNISDKNNEVNFMVINESDKEKRNFSNFTINNNEENLNDLNNYVYINKVQFKEKTKIIDVSCGINHTLCLDNKNNIYSFGDDSKIQLGLGESRTNKNSLTGTKWKDQIKFGYSSLTKNLANYSFYDRHIQSIPQMILKKINDTEIINDVYKINAGANFSMIYSNDKFGKQLFCFGDNIYFQCGRHLGKHQQTLSTVKLPNNEIKDFSCGNRHCLLNLNNKLYGWGYNNNYQISPFKNKGIINYPLCIFSDKNYPKNFNIKYINAKYDNSAIIITHKNYE